ncbi:hypothetical protein IWX64_001653 [Arthrobacter sp. CAN_A212]|uniref:septation protein SepH n=1 Tax=Arthrobacter sp. CAN_A212 TaxID=2787719 RepID=UPI0018CB4B67
MQELRLVGVHENGGHLHLNGEDGSSYSLPVNEALRMAVSRPMEQHKITTPPPPAGKPVVPLSPRDIQARIRSGATAQDIVDESGQELAHVLRYEGPVRAERDYMAILAQRVEVSSALPSHDGSRSAFGENPAQLGEMVDYRLQAYGVDPSGVEWDAWRRPDGLWNVVARFELATDARVSVGEEPPAQWTFNPSRKTVLNTNRWAQLLSELEPLDGPLPTRRLSAVADHVFDFEAQKSPEVAAEEASDNLLDVLRSRRGQRLGVDEEGDDALAHLLAKGSIPAAHPRPTEGEEELEATGSAESTDDAEGPQRFAGLSLAPSVPHDDDQEHQTYSDGSPRLSEAVSTETHEISIFARPSRPVQPSDDPAEATDDRQGRDPVPASSPKAADEPADRKIRPKRSSVPSWDEIVFGTKSD